MLMAQTAFYKAILKFEIPNRIQSSIKKKHSEGHFIFFVTGICWGQNSSMESIPLLISQPQFSDVSGPK